MSDMTDTPVADEAEAWLKAATVPPTLRQRARNRLRHCRPALAATVAFVAGGWFALSSGAPAAAVIALGVWSAGWVAYAVWAGFGAPTFEAMCQTTWNGTTAGGRWLYRTSPARRARALLRARKARRNLAAESKAYRTETVSAATEEGNNNG